MLLVIDIEFYLKQKTGLNEIGEAGSVDARSSMAQVVTEKGGYRKCEAEAFKEH